MKALLTSVSLLALLTSAQAADLPTKGPMGIAPREAPFSWTGLYFGANAGGGWGNWSGDLVYDPGTGPFPVFDPSHRKVSGSGFLGGGQVGFNWQVGPIVFGAEIDAMWSNIKTTNTFAANLNGADGYFWTIQNKLNWLGTARLRAGYLLTENLLVYGTGGFAYGQTESNETVTADHRQGFKDGTVTALASAKNNRVGWAAGGGLEYALSRSWSIRAEYLFVDLGSGDNNFVGTAYPGSPPCKGAPAVGCSFPHTTDSFRNSFDAQIVRGAINYRF